ncbi:DUF5799 family protein [Halorientalis salina]|uniref:DUF5799 family protein n=1 Tax=Halorientalis salina TaxID=2932266 RepID=UPI0010ABA98F|nr:DUF5799 family protein [Halorientalis salina]
MTDQWTDLIVGDRMTVDQQFTDRVANSQFSRQQWGLVMTAVEFDIERPDDEESAELVADTSNLPSIIPELDAVDQQGPMGGGAGRGDKSGDSSGLLGGITDALGLGGGGDGDTDQVDQDQLEAADRLAQEYATQLQNQLEDTGKWEEVRTVAAATDQ